MGKLACTDVQTLDGQACMSKQAVRPDCEYGRQLRECGCTKQLTFICGGAQKALRECGCTKQLTFICGGAQKALRESAESAKKGHGKAL